MDSDVKEPQAHTAATREVIHTARVGVVVVKAQEVPALSHEEVTTHELAWHCRGGVLKHLDKAEPIGFYVNLTPPTPLPQPAGWLDN